jgi:hypothetical protein
VANLVRIDLMRVSRIKSTVRMWVRLHAVPGSTRGRCGLGSKGIERQKIQLGLFFFAGDPDPLFHLIEIFGEGASAARCKPILGPWNPAFKELHA